MGLPLGESGRPGGGGIGRPVGETGRSGVAVSGRSSTRRASGGAAACSGGRPPAVGRPLEMTREDASDTVGAAAGSASTAGADSVSTAGAGSAGAACSAASGSGTESTGASTAGSSTTSTAGAGVSTTSTAGAGVDLDLDRNVGLGDRRLRRLVRDHRFLGGRVDLRYSGVDRLGRFDDGFGLGEPFFAAAFFGAAFLAALFLAAVFLTGLASSGCSSRLSPSRSARRVTMSAYASASDDDGPFAATPSTPHRSRTSAFVIPSSFASSWILIFLAATLSIQPFTVVFASQMLESLRI